jgi:hypothetical protein
MTVMKYSCHNRKLLEETLEKEKWKFFKKLHVLAVTVEYLSLVSFVSVQPRD